jgi:hypothetical protein
MATLAFCNTRNFVAQGGLSVRAKHLLIQWFGQQIKKINFFSLKN